jgi:hypothetical protein
MIINLRNITIIGIIAGIIRVILFSIFNGFSLIKSFFIFDEIIILFMLSYAIMYFIDTKSRRFTK